MLETPKQEQKNYPNEGKYSVYCPGGFNDGSLKEMADAEGVALPWPHSTTQTLSGKLLNRLIASGATFERISIVIPPSTKKKAAPKKKTLPKKAKAETKDVSDGKEKREGEVEESKPAEIEVTVEIKPEEAAPTDAPASPEEKTE